MSITVLSKIADDYLDPLKIGDSKLKEKLAETRNWQEIPPEIRMAIIRNISKEPLPNFAFGNYNLKQNFAQIQDYLRPMIKDGILTTYIDERTLSKISDLLEKIDPKQDEQVQLSQLLQIIYDNLDQKTLDDVDEPRKNNIVLSYSIPILKKIISHNIDLQRGCKPQLIIDKELLKQLEQLAYFKFTIRKDELKFVHDYLLSKPKKPLEIKKLLLFHQAYKYNQIKKNGGVANFEMNSKQIAYCLDLEPNETNIRSIVSKKSDIQDFLANPQQFFRSKRSKLEDCNYIKIMTDTFENSDLQKALSYFLLTFENFYINNGISVSTILFHLSGIDVKSLTNSCASRSVKTTQSRQLISKISESASLDAAAHKQDCFYIEYPDCEQVVKSDVATRPSTSSDSPDDKPQKKIHYHKHRRRHNQISPEVAAEKLSGDSEKTVPSTGATVVKQAKQEPSVSTEQNSEQHHRQTPSKLPETAYKLFGGRTSVVFTSPKQNPTRSNAAQQGKKEQQLHQTQSESKQLTIAERYVIMATSQREGKNIGDSVFEKQ